MHISHITYVVHIWLCVCACVYAVETTINRKIVREREKYSTMCAVKLKCNIRCIYRCIYSKVRVHARYSRKTAMPNLGFFSNYAGTDLYAANFANRNNSLNRITTIPICDFRSGTG